MHRYFHARAAAFAALCAAGLSGCIEGGAGVTSFLQPDGAILGLEIGVDAGSGGTLPDFDLMTIRLVSSAGDTLRDTLDANGRSVSDADMQASAVGTQASAFRPRYDVQPLSAWKIDIEVLSAGNVVEAGSVTTGRVARGDTLRVVVPLASRP